MSNIVPAKTEMVQDDRKRLLGAAGLPDSQILAAYNREHEADAEAKVDAAVAETTGG